MRPLIHAVLRNVLHRLPGTILTQLIRSRRTLSNHLPRGFTFQWPYYLGDVSVLIDLSNPIERPMVLGDYEPDVSRVVADFVRSGSYCIDVGANVGTVSLLLAKQVGPHGRVAAVEPGPPYRTRMAANLRMNPRLRDRVIVVASGLADAPGVLHWQADPNAPFNGCLHEAKPWGQSGAVLPVPVETLDALVSRLGWRGVEFIKIDVEGMEWEVFKGGRGVLQAHRPIVVFEALEIFRAYRQAVSGLDVFAEISSFLSGLGYSTYLPPRLDGPLEDRTADLLPNVVAVPAPVAVPSDYVPFQLVSKSAGHATLHQTL
jgi:FkbM family methyltransferase